MQADEAQKKASGNGTIVVCTNDNLFTPVLTNLL